MRKRYPMLFMGGLLLLSQLGALVAAGPLDAAGAKAVEDPTSPVNSAIYIGVILLFTAVMLIAAKKGFDIFIKGLFGLALLSAVYYSGLGLFLPLLGGLSTYAAAALAVATGVAVAIYPEWYVVDVSGVLVAIGVTAILGVSLSILPVLLLLLGLAIYDAIAVYRTEHMLDLADSAMNMKLPVVFVIPSRRNYSFIDEGEMPEEGEERQAFFMGLGDAIMPGVLTVSAYVFATPPQMIGSLVGSLAGFGVLTYLVASGRPQAGLPSLNGGAIAGYLVASLVTGAAVVPAIV